MAGAWGTTAGKAAADSYDDGHLLEPVMEHRQKMKAIFDEHYAHLSATHRDNLLELYMEEYMRGRSSGYMGAYACQ
jgi:hypothetical protein